MSRLLMKHALARWAVQVSIYCRSFSILVLLRLILRLNLGVVKTVLDANPVAWKKQQTSSDATTCIILMTCHDLDLRSASVWLKICFTQSEALPKLLKNVGEIVLWIARVLFSCSASIQARSRWTYHSDIIHEQKDENPHILCSWKTGVKVAHDSVM